MSRKYLNIFLIIFISVLLQGCSSPQSQPLDADAANPKAATFNIGLGMGYLKQGDTERAKVKLTRALKQAPQSADAHSAMGYFLEKTGDFKQAETYYVRAIELAPNDGAQHNNYGTFLCRMNRFQEAEQHFLKAVVSPSYIEVAESYENAGLCKLKEKQPRQAYAYFKQAYTKEPQNISVLQALIPLENRYGDPKRVSVYRIQLQQLMRNAKTNTATQLQ